MASENCAFCRRIANGQYDHGNPYAVAFAPRGGGAVEGHLMVVPRVHVERFDSMPNITGVAMVYAAELAGRLYDDFNIIVNAGAAAGQTVFHLHIHILPRVWGDQVTMPWPDHRPSPRAHDEIDKETS